MFWKNDKRRSSWIKKKGTSGIMLTPKEIFVKTVILLACRCSRERWGVKEAAFSSSAAVCARCAGCDAAMCAYAAWGESWGETTYTSTCSAFWRGLFNHQAGVIIDASFCPSGIVLLFLSSLFIQWKFQQKSRQVLRFNTQAAVTRKKNNPFMQEKEKTRSGWENGASFSRKRGDMFVFLQ